VDRIRRPTAERQSLKGICALALELQLTCGLRSKQAPQSAKVAMKRRRDTAALAVEVCCLRYEDDDRMRKKRRAAARARAERTIWSVFSHGLGSMEAQIWIDVNE